MLQFETYASGLRGAGQATVGLMKVSGALTVSNDSYCHDGAAHRVSRLSTKAATGT